MSIESEGPSGLLVYKNISVLNAGSAVKNTPGAIYGMLLQSVANAARYIKFYDKATAPVVGTDVPKMTILLNGGNAPIQMETSNGITFLNGIGIGATTGVADNNTGAPAANEVIVTIFYQ